MSPSNRGLSELQERFFAAVKQSDTGAVKLLVEEDPELVRAFDPDYFGGTALNIAVNRGSSEMIALLLEAGADPDQKSDWWAGGFAALHTIPPHLRGTIGPQLIRGGATVDAHAAAWLGDLNALEARVAENPDVVHERGGDGRMPLHFASTAEVARYLIEHGADLEARDIDHESTPIMWATAFPDVVRVLLDAGAEADVFLYTAIGDETGLATLLDRIPGAVSWVIDETHYPTKGEGVMPIYAFSLGWKSTPLHVAARCNHAGIVRLLVERGADVAVRGAYDEATPLHIAAWEGSVEAAHALLHAGAPINAVSGPEHENEPIGWAIVSGKPAIVRLLLAHDARIGDHHVRQARAGVEGEFRQWSRSSPEDWEAVQAMVMDRLSSS